MGLNTGVSYFDRIFNQASTRNYNLSIRFETDGLFYSIYNPEEQKYIGFEISLHSGIAELYEYISKHQWLRNDFHKSTVIIPSKQYTLIPDALYSRESNSEYFNFVHQLSTTHKLLSFDLVSQDSKLIYASDVNYIELVEEFFTQAIIIPQPAAFLTYILPRFRNKRASMIFINLYNEDFDVLVMDDGKMRYFNNFIYKAPEDLVYYILFVIDQLSLNPEKVEVMLSGKIESKSNILRLLKKYIRFVNILSYDDDVKSSYVINEVETHRYTDILNPMLCEL